MHNKQKKKLKAMAKEEEKARRNARNIPTTADPFEKTLEDENYNPTKK
jgi:hypothetical protein